MENTDRGISAHRGKARGTRVCSYIFRVLKKNTLLLCCGEHIYLSHIAKGIILLLIMDCYYALLLFGKNACFRKINLDSSIFQTTKPSVPGFQRTIKSEFFPHNQTGSFLWEEGHGWSVWHLASKSATEMQKGLPWQDTFASCSI